MGDLFWFAVFTGCNGLIIVALASVVSWRRITLRIPHGDGNQIPMKQAIRAHGNAVEHIPIMGLIVLGLCLVGATPALLASLVCGFTLARLLHPVGMFTTAFTARRVGATVSYVAEAVGALVLLATALGG